MKDGRLVSSHRANVWLEPQEGFTVRDLMLTLRRRKWTLAAFLSAGVALGCVYSSFVTPIYAAEAVVALKEDKGGVEFDQAAQILTGQDSSRANMEVVVLTSRELLKNVVDKANLLEDPEFNTYLRPQESWLPWGSAAADDQAGGARELPDAEVMRERAVDILIKKLLVETVNDTEAFLVRVETWHPEKSARIANQIAQSYIAQQLEAKFDTMRQTGRWLSEQVVDLQEKLEEAEVAVQDHIASSPLIAEGAVTAQMGGLANSGIQDHLSNGMIQLNSLRERLQDVLEEQSEVEAQLAEPDESDGASERSGGEQARLQQLLKKLTSQAEVLKRAIAESEALMAEGSAALVRMRQLQREAEATRVLYEFFLTRVKELSAQEGMQQPEARILSEAVVRPLPVFPKEGRLMVFVGAFALLLGGISVLVSEQSNDTVRSPRELQTFGGWPVLGEVPEAPIRRRQRLLDYLKRHPASAFSEALRGLRTSIMLSVADHPPKVVLVTSSVPAEGKTTLSVGLAVSAAGARKRVLLVDCDSRRPSLHDHFGLDDGPGLLAVLAGEAHLEDAVRRDEPSRVDVLTMEELAGASEVFASAEFERLLATLRDRYDLILLDAPPILAVSDARSMAKLADVTVLAVRWNSTSRMVVSQALDSLETAKPAMGGLALTRHDPRRMADYSFGGDRFYKAINRYYE